MTSDITNVEEIFKSISSQLNQTEKHFKLVKIIRPKGSQVYELVLNENSFWDITFDQFQSNDIVKIHHNAFGKAAQTVKKVVLNPSSHITHQPPEYHIWKFLNRLVNVEYIHIELDIDEIPSEALNQKSLNTLIIRNRQNEMTIKKNAFYNLDNLKELKLLGSIKKIQSQAFALAKKSNQLLNIIFTNVDTFFGNPYVPDSFKGLRRPVNITFLNLINYLPE